MKIITKSKHTVLGIMSGTSLDGVDYALCEVSPTGIKLKKLWSVSYPTALKNRILSAASNALSSYELAQLHHDLGRFYALKAPKAQFDYIGLHGQTIFHNPAKPNSATSQIGEPAYLSVKYKRPVISQFRNMDLAMGGQGAPLATLFHKTVFGKYGKSVAVINLGGISNVTYLGRNKILSFDMGPANMLIDYAVMEVTKGRLKYDAQGKIAALGIANESLVKSWLKHPFIKAKPPKSTGREEFGPIFFKKTWTDCKKEKLSSPDSVATYTKFTGECIAENFALHLPEMPDLVILSGGGAANPTLRKVITQSLRAREWSIKKQNLKSPIQIVTTDESGWPNQSIEAAAFALLAYQTMTGKTGNLPKTTGASRAAILGQITPAP
jgi:anhydro-N-acetylmuramic acid kinase